MKTMMVREWWIVTIVSYVYPARKWTASHDCQFVSMTERSGRQDDEMIDSMHPGGLLWLAQVVAVADCHWCLGE